MLNKNASLGEALLCSLQWTKLEHATPFQSNGIPHHRVEVFFQATTTHKGDKIGKISMDARSQQQVKAQRWPPDMRAGDVYGFKQLIAQCTSST